MDRVRPPASPLLPGHAPLLRALLAATAAAAVHLAHLARARLLARHWQMLAREWGQLKCEALRGAAARDAALSSLLALLAPRRAAKAPPAAEPGRFARMATVIGLRAAEQPAALLPAFSPILAPYCWNADLLPERLEPLDSPPAGPSPGTPRAPPRCGLMDPFEPPCWPEAAAGGPIEEPRRSPRAFPPRAPTPFAFWDDDDADSVDARSCGSWVSVGGLAD
jgi:hypothetical protein